MNADRERIDQVVANLLDNAVKSSPCGWPVEARIGGEAVARNDGWTRFEPEGGRDAAVHAGLPPAPERRHGA